MRITKKAVVSGLIILSLFLTACGQEDMLDNGNVSDITDTADTHDPYLDVNGKWKMFKAASKENMTDSLTWIGFEEKEIAYADPELFGAVVTYDFRNDKTYELKVDAELTRESLVEFYDDLVTELFNNRSLLTDVYGDEVVDCIDVEEFHTVYAYFYEFKTYDELLSYFADMTYDYDVFAKAMEQGTYRFENNYIFFARDDEFIPEGEQKEIYVEYAVTDDTLMLIYKDVINVYTPTAAG